MNDEIDKTYTYILVKDDGTYLGWSKAQEVGEAGDGMKWVKWGKELPEDIEEGEYVYADGELVNPL